MCVEVSKGEVYLFVTKIEVAAGNDGGVGADRGHLLEKRAQLLHPVGLPFLGAFQVSVEQAQLFGIVDQNLGGRLGQVRPTRVDARLAHIPQF